MSEPKPAIDPRVAQTRTAILGSFNGLVLDRPYDSVQIGEIVDRAAVGRSTFYEHFRGKEELLLHAATHVLRIMAAAVRSSEPAPAPRRDDNPGPQFETLLGAVEHFREFRPSVLAMLTGASGPRLAWRLAELLEAAIREELGEEARAALPVPLIAAQIAAAQLGLVREWLEGRVSCQPAAIAEAIRKTSRAMVMSLTIS